MVESPARPAAAPVARRRLRSAFALIAALALYALLIDAAWETWQSLSPVRLWIAVPVALYVSFSVWLLRQHSAHRPSAGTAAWVSVFLLLAVLAVTSTQPGGVTSGVIAATLSTSAVLTLASLGVLLLAFVSLVLVLALPLPARVLAGGAAVYAMVALVMGLVAGRSYVQLLQGGSPWERLPYWLQGAFVGMLIVVPLAFGLEIVAALASLKLRGRRHRIVAFALGIVIAYSAWTYTK